MRIYVLALCAVVVVGVPTCPAGKYAGPSMQETGTCTNPIVTKAECEAAATTLALEETEANYYYGINNPVVDGNGVCLYRWALNILYVKEASGSVQGCGEGSYADICICWACIDCPSGTHEATAGARTSCTGTECAVGEGGIVGSTTAATCAVCPQGQYSTISGAECTPCPAGLQDSSAHSTCALQCPAGQYYGGAYITLNSGTCPAPVGSLTHYNKYAEHDQYEVEAAECRRFTTMEGLPWTYYTNNALYIERNSEAPTRPYGCYNHDGYGAYNAYRGSATDCSATMECYCPGCGACPSGKYSVSGGTEGCSGTSCPSGKYGVSGSTSSAAAVCENCAADTFSNVEGAASCSACASGKSSGPGAVACAPVCPAGQYYGYVELLTGTSCYEDIGSATECSTAAAYLGLGGNVSTVSGRNAAGSKCSYDDVNSKIYFQTGAVSGSGVCDDGSYYCICKGCDDCPSGMYAIAASGRFICDGVPCAAGEIGPRGSVSQAGATCTPCAANTFASDSTTCTDCPSGRLSGTGATECLLYCPPGKFHLGSETCDVCPPGKYNPTGSTGTACLGNMCASGEVGPTERVSASAATCTACTAGMYAATTTCQDCAAGRWSTDTAVDCGLCASGNYLNVSTCITCPSGTYADSPSLNTACTGTVCSGGYAGPEGSTDAASASCSACEAGKFSSSAGSTTCTACGSQQGSKDVATECVEGCNAGASYGGYTRLTTISTCSRPIVTDTECWGAAALLAAGDTSISLTQFTYGYNEFTKPKGCILYSYGGLNYAEFNPSASSQGCSLTYSDHTCICSHCTHCTPGKYNTDPGKQKQLCDGPGCALGEEGPHGSTSAADAVCTPCAAGRYGTSDYQCLDCTAGRSSLEGATRCYKVCGAGAYLETEYTEVCHTCVSGKWSIANTRVSCTGTACAAGRSGPEGSGSAAAAACTDCTAGRYQDSPASASCKECGVDSVSEPGQVQCTPICPAGKESIVATNTCEDCKSGMYTSQPGIANVCAGAPCPLDYFGPTGSTSPTCTLCPEGTFTLDTASTSCNSCPVGQAALNRSCHECTPGTFKPTSNGPFVIRTSNYCGPDNGMITTDDLCYAARGDNPWWAHSGSPIQTTLKYGCQIFSQPIGISNEFQHHVVYVPLTLNGSHDQVSEIYLCNEETDLSLHLCHDCPAGRYQTTTGASECVACAAGKSSDMKSTSCTNCSEAQFSEEGGLCRDCPGGKFQPSDHLCQLCPEGKTSTDRSTSCADCAPGNYARYPGSPTCTPCDENTYGTSPGSSLTTDCLPCPNGTISRAGASECLLCPSGTRLNTFNVSCDDCPLHGWTRGLVNSLECLSCPIGKFTNSTGGSECYACTANTVGNYKYEVIDTWSHVVSDGCVCEAGKYTTGGNINQICDVCPSGKHAATIRYEQNIRDHLKLRTHHGTCEDEHETVFDLGGIITSEDACKAAAINTIYGASPENDPNVAVQVVTDNTKPSGCLLYSDSSVLFNTATTQVKCGPNLQAAWEATGCTTTVPANTVLSSQTQATSQVLTGNSLRFVVMHAICDTARGGNEISEIRCCGIAGCGSSINTCVAQNPDPACLCGDIVPVTVPDGCTCVPGKYNAPDGSCLDCPAGKYQPNNQPACTSCDIGKYAPQINSTECLECPTYLWSYSNGSSVCTACPAGSIGQTLQEIGLRRYNCLTNIWINDTVCDIDFCLTCPSGKYHVDGTQTCELCPTGRYSLAEGSGATFVDCIACPQGKSNSFYGNRTTCDKCDAGTTTNGTGQSCTIVCPAGTYSEYECIDCPRGMYQDLIGTSRQVTYNSIVRDDICKSCPAGRYGLLQGAISVEEGCLVATQEQLQLAWEITGCN